MVLMAVLGLLLLVGVGLTLWWGGTAYQSADAATPANREAPTLRTTTLAYLRGVAIALVGGFWAGVLVTGPAMRLIMRLLAATGGDAAQGRLTEAEEVVGNIDFDGTLGLLVFGGLLPGLLSGGIYLLIRRWLPSGRLGGIAFGALHLVIAATRFDPLRPDNPDFDIVGPGWLAALTFGLAAIVHGMAVVAIANRFSVGFPPTATDRVPRPGLPPSRASGAHPHPRVLPAHPDRAGPGSRTRRIPCGSRTTHRTEPARPCRRASSHRCRRRGPAARHGARPT